MSVSSTIGNIRNARDLQNKRADFFKTLKLQADLNKRYEDAMIQRAQIERMGVQPVQQIPRSMEEERRDELGQQQIALRHLESILTASQAMKALKDLPMEQIYLLNRYWGKFKETIRGIRVDDADYFRRLFLNFLSVAEETEDFIRPIPLRESTLARISGDLQDMWNGWSRGQIDAMTGKQMELARLVERTAMELKRSAQDVAAEIKAEQAAQKRIDDTGVEGVARMFAQTKPTKGKAKKLAPAKAEPKLIEQTAFDIGLTTSPTAKIESVPFTQERAVQLTTALRDANLTDSLTAKQMRAILQPFGKTGRTRADLLSKINEFVLGSATVAVKEEGRGGLYMTPPPPKRGKGGVQYALQPTMETSRVHTVYRGDGKLRPGMMKPVHLFGRGIAPQAPPIKRENNYRQFGKYLVNMKYLDQGILALYHETMKRVSAIPQRMISPQFQDIVYTILEKEQLPRSKFYKLSEMEQSFLDDVLRRAWLNEKLGMGGNIASRKKPSLAQPCPEDDEDMRRFHLLKGIVIAGNNDKRVVNELMSYLHKFVEEKRIEPKMGKDILRNLQIATY
jgi:hypothetical protein